jgi:hypothetical protein
MTKPEFQPKLNSSGTWFVAVATGHGADSQIGDFLTEEEAQHWILTKSKYWPSKPDAPNTPSRPRAPNQRANKDGRGPEPPRCLSAAYPKPTYRADSRDA